MNETHAATIILGILGIMIPILAVLVGTLYKTIVKEQDAITRAQEEHIKENRERELQILKEAESVHKSLWNAVNSNKEQFHVVDSKHSTLCQKHEDNMQRLEDKINVLESKIKGQEDFFKARLTELSKRNK